MDKFENRKNLQILFSSTILKASELARNLNHIDDFESQNLGNFFSASQNATQEEFLNHSRHYVGNGMLRSLSWVLPGATDGTMDIRYTNSVDEQFTRSRIADPAALPPSQQSLEKQISSAWTSPQEDGKPGRLIWIVSPLSPPGELVHTQGTSLPGGGSTECRRTVVGFPSSGIRLYKTGASVEGNGISNLSWTGDLTQRGQLVGSLCVFTNPKLPPLPAIWLNSSEMP